MENDAQHRRGARSKETVMPQPSLYTAQLRPYISGLVLQYTGAQPDKALSGLRAQIEKSLKRRRGEIAIVAAGLDDHDNQPNAEGVPAVDEVDAFAYRQTLSPSWATLDAQFRDVTHHGVFMFRRGALLAVCANESIRESIRSWIRSKEVPPYALVPEPFINEALLRGRTRSLNLHGAHPPQGGKADTKSMYGGDLRVAMNPAEDSTYVFSSARAQVDENAHVAVQGVVGATPGKGNIWNGPSESFEHFEDAVAELLWVISEAMTGAGLEQPFPLLATKLGSLAGVAEAYEMRVQTRAEIEFTTGATDDALAAAELLERALLEVVKSDQTPDFELSVGFDGAMAGVVAVHVSIDQGTPHLQFGIAGHPTAAADFAQIRDALNAYPDHVSVFYASGHALVSGGAITRPVIRPVAFNGWQWWPCNNCEVTTEKPPGTPGEMDKAIGLPGDNSIFGLVVANLDAGWLTCDDGPGEVADFVHMALDGTLTLVHAKGAASNSVNRRVSASSYEVVVSQAVKNTGFLEQIDLVVELSKNKSRPTWLDGVREADRTGFLKALATRKQAAPSRVMIVQPHMRKTRYDELADPAYAGSADLLRLQRLETLLNSYGGMLMGYGRQLIVIGSA